MKNIIFRTDSSSKIGIGHVMRDFVLAEQLDKDNIIFAVQDLPGNINHKIRQKGYIVETLGSNDIQEVISLIDKHSADMIVIDHYDIGYDYECELKAGTGVKIFALDDTYEKHNCDILLNHNLGAIESKYINLVPDNCELRCGEKYTLIRSEFVTEKQKRKRLKSGNRYKNIFIAVGGADPYDLNFKILHVLEGFQNIKVNLVTTGSNLRLQGLKEYVCLKDNIHLYIDSDKIARIMGEADFAIVTPSVTAHEILYMGVPFIAIKTAENQHVMTDYLLNNGHHVLPEFDKDNLRKQLEHLMGIGRPG